MNEIKNFFIGVIAGVIAAVFVVLRKKLCNNGKPAPETGTGLDDSAERIDNIEGRIETASDAVADGLNIIAAVRSQEQKEVN